MTRQEEIRGWFQSGVEDGCSHLLVCRDTFNHTIFPVYVEKHESAHAVFSQEEAGKNIKVNEVYNLSRDCEEQIAQVCSRNF